VDSSGLSLGRHEGIAFYTPGQRKGLGLATGKRLYVNQVIPETNTIVVGSQEELATWECCVSELNLFEAKEPLDGAQVEVKIRYASPPVPATLTMTDESTVLVKFVSPQWAVSPGQSAVFYKKNRVLGGGIIKRMNRSHLPALPLPPGN
jgi:tRNA-specific 2-thiouridylase